jgi:hypothetical protein
VLRLDVLATLGEPRVRRDVAMGRCVIIALLGLTIGCAELPALTFTDDDGGTSDAGASTPPSEAGLRDSSSPADATAADAGASDGGDRDAANPLACLPADPPPAARCCTATLRCVGTACNHCDDCSSIKTPCTATQYCCAEVNGNGKYKGVSCSATGMNCP